MTERSMHDLLDRLNQSRSALQKAHAEFQKASAVHDAAFAKYAADLDELYKLAERVDKWCGFCGVNCDSDHK